MLDLKFIRENADIVKKSIKARDIDVDVDGLLELDTRRRSAVSEVEVLRK